MIVVRIVQNRAPSEVSYCLDDDADVGAFIARWNAENPHRWISGGSMPLIDMRYHGRRLPIPVEYPVGPNPEDKQA